MTTFCITICDYPDCNREIGYSFEHRHFERKKELINSSGQGYMSEAVDLCQTHRELDPPEVWEAILTKSGKTMSKKEGI